MVTLNPATFNHKDELPQCPARHLGTCKPFPDTSPKGWVPESCLLHLGYSGTQAECLGHSWVSVPQEMGGAAVCRTIGLWLV